MFKRSLSKIKNSFLMAGVFLTTLPCLAELPKPPDGDIANDTSDWIDVGGALTYKTLSYALIALGAMIVAGAAFGTFKAYHTAQERQDLGHFFKHAAVGLAAAAIGAGLLYAGYQIITNN
ncbi:MAG TPA: hypothetical protein VHE99_03030 [Gammaproteobacteria bacterium]|nr:hypothetical protein [Gammaproteobacteria bacterium]HVY53943.1 hypothetical protein [Gammaproteobacteria bacterium]